VFSPGAAEGGQLHPWRNSPLLWGRWALAAVAEASPRADTTQGLCQRQQGGSEKADPGHQPERTEASIIRRASDDQLNGARAQGGTVAADPPRSVSARPNSMARPGDCLRNPAPSGARQTAPAWPHSAAAPWGPGGSPLPAPPGMDSRLPHQSRRASASFPPDPAQPIGRHDRGSRKAMLIALARNRTHRMGRVAPAAAKPGRCQCGALAHPHRKPLRKVRARRPGQGKWFASQAGRARQRARPIRGRSAFACRYRPRFSQPELRARRPLAPWNTLKPPLAPRLEMNRVVGHEARVGR